MPFKMALAKCGERGELLTGKSRYYFHRKGKWILARQTTNFHSIDPAP
jgi:hypothetical protein